MVLQKDIWLNRVRTERAKAGSDLSKPACLSEVQLECDLRNTTWLGLQNSAKGGVITIAIDRTCTVKLCVVKGIEGLKAEFQRA